VHVEHLFVENEKMSKSLGNVYTLPTSSRAVIASALRYLLLSSHYRKQLNFTWAGWTGRGVAAPDRRFPRRLEDVYGEQTFARCRPPSTRRARRFAGARTI
jgi:cysteinyl-tRNA synthetase